MSGLAGWIEARLGFLQWATPVADTAGGQARWPILPDGRLPERCGETPEVSVTTPQQQQSQNAPVGLQEALFDRIVQLDGVATAPSAISVPGARALWLADGAAGPPEAFMIGNEFAHLHPGADQSLHAMLPPQLAEDAIVAGWAEVHPVARRGLISPNAVMIYAPRDDEEREMVEALVRASHAFARGLT